MKSKLLLLFSFFLLFFSCGDKNEIVIFPEIENKYDPSKPLLVERIMPDYGGIDQTFVLTGNFKGELDDMKVYFGNKLAILVATDGQSIMGVVPKQSPGNNLISVVIGNDSISDADLRFKYKQTRSVKTIAGFMGNREYIDGDINAARFKEPSCIATVKGQNGDNIVVIESWWENRVRLVSLDDNKVITLATGPNVAGGTPAVDNTREKFYTIGHWGDQHHIYSYSRADGWTQTVTGIQIAQSDASSNIFSIQCADDDDYLYTLSATADFFEIDLKDRSYSRVLLRGPNLPTNYSDRSHVVWSKFHNCFFASFPNEHGIYRFSPVYEEDGLLYTDVSRYAGFNGTGSTGGHRLTDAQFIGPHGMAVTSEGDIFVVNRSGNFISQISGDLVEVVAGRPGSSGEINGDPLDSRFNSPQDIAVDFEDNFYIAGGWDGAVRKLSIE